MIDPGISRMRNMPSRRTLPARSRSLPPAHSHRTVRALGIVVLLAAVLIGAAGFIPQPSLVSGPVTPTPAAPAVAAVSAPAPTPTATQAPEPQQTAEENQPATETTGTRYAPCDAECLVRLPASQAALAVLTE